MYKFMKSHGDCHINFVKIVAAFPGMHVSPGKHSFGSVTDGQTTDKVIPMCRYASQATQKLVKCGMCH